VGFSPEKQNPKNLLIPKIPVQTFYADNGIRIKIQKKFVFKKIL
jgi:hypothetical protein